jgi:hypothetical protein
MKKTLNLFALSLCITILMSSCLTTKTQVGGYREQTGEEYTYAKSHQIWIFWSLLPLGRASTNTPPDGNCEVITRFSFGDLLISSLTGGLVTTQTIKIKAKRTAN